MHGNWCQQYPRLRLNSQLPIYLLQACLICLQKAPSASSFMQTHGCHSRVSALIEEIPNKFFTLIFLCCRHKMTVEPNLYWKIYLWERVKIFTRRRNDNLHDKLVVSSDPDLQNVPATAASWPVTSWHVTSGTCGSAVDLPVCLRPPLRCALNCMSPWNLLGGSGSLPEFALRNGCGSAITSAM